MGSWNNFWTNVVIVTMLEYLGVRENAIKLAKSVLNVSLLNNIYRYNAWLLHKMRKLESVFLVNVFGKILPAFEVK
jgi:hypothetical protein